ARCSAVVRVVVGGMADPGWFALPLGIVCLGESSGARGKGTPRSSFDVQESTTRWWADDVPLPVLYPGWHLFHNPVVPLGRARAVSAPDGGPARTTVACVVGIGTRGSTALAKGLAKARGTCGTRPASGRDSPADRSARR